MPSRTTETLLRPADDQDKHLRTDDLIKDLGRRTARGGVVTIASQGTKFLLSMVGTVVLARLLTPEDYGLIGMVAVITGFISVFKDLGLSAATIQSPEVSKQQVSTLFWLNLLLSFGIALLTAALAPSVAWFYGEPKLTGITLAYAGGFLFGGLAVQHEALLRRRMRFTVLAIAEIWSLTVSVVVAIVLARNGARYWALVVSQLALGLTYTVAVWMACRWRPGLPVRNSGVRPMIAFGGNLTGFSVINYFARNIDNLLIGRYWGPVQLGLYARAYQLLLLPIDQINTPITAVAVPALSRLNQSPMRYRAAYLRLLEKIALLTMPGMVFMIATSDWLVAILLGPKWIGVSRIFALLGIVGLVQPIASTTGWLFITQGRTRDMFKWGMIGSTILIVGIIAGLKWGATGVAASYSLTFIFIVTPLLFWFVGRKGPVRTSDFYRTIGPVLLATICGLVTCLAFRKWWPTGNRVQDISICLLICVVIPIVVLMSMPTGRSMLLDLKKSALLLVVKKQDSMGET